MQSDWEDRKGRFPICYFYSTECVWIFVAGESQFKTASCPARGFYGVCYELLAVLKHVLVAPFPRAKRSFGARGALIRFIVAVMASGFVESRQREDSSTCCSSGVAEGSSITRTAAFA